MKLLDGNSILFVPSPGSHQIVGTLWCTFAGMGWTTELDMDIQKTMSMAKGWYDGLISSAEQKKFINDTLANPGYTAEFKKVFRYAIQKRTAWAPTPLPYSAGPRPGLVPFAWHCGRAIHLEMSEDLQGLVPATTFLSADNSFWWESGKLSNNTEEDFPGAGAEFLIAKRAKELAIASRSLTKRMAKGLVLDRERDNSQVQPLVVLQGHSERGPKAPSCFFGRPMYYLELDEDEDQVGPAKLTAPINWAWVEKFGIDVDEYTLNQTPVPRHALLSGHSDQYAGFHMVPEYQNRVLDIKDPLDVTPKIFLGADLFPESLKRAEAVIFDQWKLG